MATIGSLYEMGRRELEQAQITEAALDARILLEESCHVTRNDLLVHASKEVAPQEASLYEAWIKQRAERIPLQHLTGTQCFMGLEFDVNPNVLIPRSDTEILVEEALEQVHDGMRVLDLCTGSGCILISLLHYKNDCSGVGVDFSEGALETAYANAARLLGDRYQVSSTWKEECGGAIDCQFAGSTCTFMKADLLKDAAYARMGMFEVIVSNPPYIASSEIEKLEPEVKDHEPRMALDGSLDGLVFYDKMIEMTWSHLCGGGVLLFEIGFDQGEAVSKRMMEKGFLEVTVKQDYAGLDRVVFGTKPSGLIEME